MVSSEPHKKRLFLIYKTDLELLDKGGSRISGKGVHMYKCVCVCVCVGGGAAGFALILSHFSFKLCHENEINYFFFI